MIRIPVKSLCVALSLSIIPNSPSFAQQNTNLLYGSAQSRQNDTNYNYVFAGLIVGAALYGILAPEPDQFRIDFSNFVATPNTEETGYHYSVRNREVTAEEFFRTMDEEIEHHNRAESKRQSAKSRMRGILGLAFASYLFMLGDTLWHGPGEVDARYSRFSLQVVPNGDDIVDSRSFSLRLCVILR